MLKLPHDKIDSAQKYIMAHCRPLEKARFNLLFKKGNTDEVISELRKFQNADGGFGHGLEPDFMLPESSPLASTIAFQCLDDISEPHEDIVGKAVQYLEHTFVADRHGWFCVPEQVNNYPHAKWWHWDTLKKQTVIDETWGNPTAEIVGILNKYSRFVTRLDLAKLTEHTINYWERKTDFSSEHEVFCFIRLYKHLPIDQAKRLAKNIKVATQKLVALDSEQWKTYNPQPVQFEEFADAGVEENLDFIVNSINENGMWEPNWTWHQYADFWPQQRVQWEGVITIGNLKRLSAHHRLDA